MDNQNPQLQQPIITHAPAPRSHMLIIVVVGLVMFGVGLGGGYLLFSNHPKRTQFEDLQTTPTIMQSPKPVTTELPERILQASSSPVDSTSSDKSYTVIRKVIGDGQKISIVGSDGTEISENILVTNNEKIDKNMRALGLTGGGQIGYWIKEWKNNTIFILLITPANGMEFEVAVDAKTGMIDESSFKKIK